MSTPQSPLTSNAPSREGGGEVCTRFAPVSTPVPLRRKESTPILRMASPRKNQPPRPGVAPNFFRLALVKRLGCLLTTSDPSEESA